MSSTTDPAAVRAPNAGDTGRCDRRGEPRKAAGRRGQRGQVVVIFAGGLVAFLAVAALVFDVGQDLLDWRAQRNAADAAALAGSRYIAEPACLANPSIGACLSAYQAAIHVAALNGYGDLNGDSVDDNGHVDVHIPPLPGRNYAGLPGFIEVDVHTDRPSFFAAVVGVLRQNVDTLAVAGNSTGVAPPWSMLALNPDCDPNPSGQVGGNGDVNVEGAVAVDSNCDGALLVNGNGHLSAPECDVVGTAQTAGANASMDCPVVHFEGTGDPLSGISPGAMPGKPAAVEILSWNAGGQPTIPAGCPGSTVAISFVAGAYANGSAIATMPTYATGDLAVVFAYRSGSVTPPDLPAGWTDVASSTGADLNSRRVGYRVLDGSELSSGTWTNATSLEMAIVRGQDTDVPIGVHASAGSAGTTLTTPALSLTSTPTASSWVLAFGGATSGANAGTLSGTTARNGPITALALNTGQNVTTWTQRNYVGAVVGPNRTDAVEILANPNPSTAANPVGCALNGAGAQKYNVFRIHPGTYFGGLAFKSKARVYLAPGTYWLAGGGFTVNAKDAQVISVDGPSSTTPGRGVLIYDTEDSGYCGVASGNPCIGDIKVNGTSTNACPSPPQPSLGAPFTPNPPTQPCQWIHLEPTDSPIKNLLVYVDRTLTANVFFNGSAGKIDLNGTMYDPNGDVSINGSADDSVAAQIIANTFKITGNGGFTVTYDSGGFVQLKGVGLVQ